MNLKDLFGPDFKQPSREPVEQKQYPRVGDGKPMNQWDKSKYDTTNPHHGIDTGPDKEPEYKKEPGDRNIRDMSQDPKFMQWFGKSRCVDRYGKPLLMFHGTTYNRDGDNPALSKFATGGKGLLSDVGGSSQEAFYFTPSSDYAHSYGDTLYPVYLRVLNPVVVNSYDEMKRMGPVQVQMYQRMGFDGAVEHDSVEWCVFDASQIKSATGNNGNYSADSGHMGESVE